MSLAPWIGTVLALSVADGAPARSASSTSPPQIVAPASLRFQHGIMAWRPGDRRLYVLLGSGFLRPLTTGSAETYVARWLVRHPGAAVIPVSRLLTTNTISRVQGEIDYVWIEDGTASLNVDLVRDGIFMAATMVDMVDNRRALDALLARDPRLADARAQIATERAAAPQDRDERLVDDETYRAQLTRFDTAERDARAARRGIWSNAMKDEREAEEVR